MTAQSADLNKKLWVAAIVAVLGSTGLNTGIQLSFPARKDAFTRQNAEHMRDDMLRDWEKKLDEYKERMEIQMIEISEAKIAWIPLEIQRAESDLKLYCRENFLPVGTPIPPPEVDNGLKLAHSRLDRLDLRIEDVRDRLTECCAQLPRSQIDSVWRKEYAPVVPHMVLRVK